MRLADDRRARVPFALVGVLLLVSSAAFAGAVGQRTPVAVDSDAGGARHEAVAAARTALATATERAAHAAARRPVIEAANTSTGRVLDEDDAFADALRARIYLRAHRALENVSATRGQGSATVSVPPVTNASTLRSAIERVRLGPRNASGFRVRLRNVSVTVRQGGRVVERERVTLSTVVRSPVLDLHARTSRFARALDRGAGPPGLGSRLRRNLLAVAWARGYAQYGGAPVANVVGTRHVGLATNLAVRDLQRSVFGRADARIGGPLGRAAAAVGGTDLLAGAAESGPAWTDLLFGPGAVADATLPRADAADHANDTARVAVNLTADRALRDVLGGRDGPSLDAVVADVFAASVRLERSVTCSTTTTRRGGRPPGWRLAGSSRSNETVVERSEARAPPPDRGHVLARYAWTETQVRRVDRTWTDGNQSTRTHTTTRDRRRVVVTVVGRHAPTATPDRPFAGAHRPGGPLDGRNFAAVRDRAVERLVAERGGVAALRERALNGTLNGSRTRLAVSRPTGLRAWLYRDLARLRERVRNRSVRVRHDQLAATAPSAALLAALRGNRSVLLDAPAAYGSAAAAARAAARKRYLDALETRLAERAADARAARDGLETALPADATLAVGSILGGGGGGDGGGQTPVTSVRGVPPYLSTSAVTPAQADGLANATHPLVTRNVNEVTVPYGPVASAVASAVVPESRDGVGLHAAASTLRAANRSLAATSNATLASEREALRTRVDRAVALVRVRLAAALVDAPGDLTRESADAAVRRALDRWASVHARALAAANGSLAPAVVAAAPPAPNRTAADRRAMAVRLALQSAVGDARVPLEHVSSVSDATRDLARDAVATGVEAGLRRAGSASARALGGALSAVPAGAPVAPVPSLWATTFNAWDVTVRGRYERFAVSAVAGSPRPSPNLTYVRENRTVRLDIDDDGTRERLGRNRRVSFDVSVYVPVLVPPYGSGVGDVDGVRDERSAGWPRPGPVDDG